MEIVGKIVELDDVPRCSECVHDDLDPYQYPCNTCNGLIAIELSFFVQK